MDRVRLGRALGYGARHAARTVAAVVEAANTPSPAGAPPQTPAPASHSPVREDVVFRTVAHQTTAGIASGSRRASAEDGSRRASAKDGRGRATAGDVGRGFAHLRRSVWGPLAVFSGALWLRVTGLFFGLIAFTIGAGAWRLRMGWHGALATRFWTFVAVAALFAYFAVSSFVRASVRERRAASDSMPRQ